MSPSESLRERKKRQTRQLLADTATQMFLARGFDGVRVSEIAEACGVSEKTVFNYFPTKEALVMDRLDDASDALLTALADPHVSPVRAAVDVLGDELAMMVHQKTRPRTSSQERSSRMLPVASAMLVSAAP